MARSREELQNTLEQILGSRNVYFQPPESIKLKYPCIIYEIGDFYNSYASNKKYVDYTRYSVTIIDKNPDSKLPDKLKNLDYCSMDRFFINDNLNHYVFTLYY